MKDFAKSIVCNTKAGNSNKAEIIKKKKKEGATLKVDNGQKLEFSDGSTYVKTSFSDDYREAHNYTGNETLHEYVTSKPKVINDEKTGAEEFFKQLSDDVKEREKKDDEEIEKAKKEGYGSHISGVQGKKVILK